MFHVKHTAIFWSWARILGCAIVAADDPHNSDHESKRWGWQDHHHDQSGSDAGSWDMKVLIVDADPQGNSTSGLGLRGKFRKGFYQALILNEPLSP